MLVKDEDERIQTVSELIVLALNALQPFDSNSIESFYLSDAHTALKNIVHMSEVVSSIIADLCGVDDFSVEFMMEIGREENNQLGFFIDEESTNLFDGFKNYILSHYVMITNIITTSKRSIPEKEKVNLYRNQLLQWARNLSKYGMKLREFQNLLSQLFPEYRNLFTGSYRDMYLAVKSEYLMRSSQSSQSDA